MTEVPILYSFRRCPYAMRARLALQASGIAFVIREVTLRNKPAEMLEASPKATVPVLVLPDGTVIDESLSIMRWALAVNDPEDWLGADDSAVVATNDGDFKRHLDGYKYGCDTGDRDLHRAAGLDILRGLDSSLGNTPNLRRDAPGLVDMAVMPFVRQFAETDRAWFDDQPLPRLQAWLACHCASDRFAAAMVRLSPWQPGQAGSSL